MTATWFAQGENEVPADRDWLSNWEHDRLARMRYPKRANDYLLGRWTAKRALSLSLGVAIGDLDVRAASSGAPEPRVGGAPALVSISITDRAGWAVAAVADSPALTIGCDLELVEPRSARFVADYLTNAERRCVDAAGTARDLYANAMWSAKESALKVLQTGLRRDTRSVEVDLGSGASVAGSWCPLEVVDTTCGTAFPGWWRRFGSFVLTFAASARFDPPAPMRGSADLSDAEPTHTWMTGRRL